MFRLLIAAFAAAMLMSIAPSTHAQEPPLLGDVNCDGDVNTIDASLILQLDLGIDFSSLRSLCLAAADTNDDGNVDTIDASLVLQLVRGLIDGLPPVPPDPLPPPASGAVSIGSAENQFGHITSLSLEAHDVTSPGLGAWSIDVKYDPTVVSIVECLGGQGAFCNAEYAVGVVRLSHASSGTDDFRGLELAELTFECITVSGMTDLIVNVRTFADATVGGPQPINPTVTNGSITCVSPMPRPGYGRLNITLIHDLDADGIFDLGEPGLEGWLLSLDCGDDRGSLPETNADGQTTGIAYGEKACVQLERAGWRATSHPQSLSGMVSVAVEPGTTTEVQILLRKIGQDVWRFVGDLIVDGLPAPLDTEVDALVDGQRCGDALVVEPLHGATWYSLYVLGDRDRSGCARDGQEISLAINDEIVRQVTFTLGQLRVSEATHLVLGPTPMWFFERGRDGESPVPYVGSVVCGEARRMTGWPHQLDDHNVYVFPDALRSGCGAPGRIVTLRVGDEVLRQIVWQEGFVPFDQLRDVELPIVGADAQPGGSGFSLTGAGSARAYAIALSIAGLSMLFGGAVVWRRRRAG